MAVAPVAIKPNPVAPARFNLLDTIKPVSAERVGQGVEYPSEFCGVARPFSAYCDPADLGSIEVEVDDARLATITSTGFPDGTYRIVWGDGDETASEAEQLNETHQYLTDDTFVVQVYGNGDVGLYAEVTVTVEDGVASGPFEADATETKVADDGRVFVVGEAFPIYHLFSCRLVGDTDAEARALRSLNLGASRAVEEGFQQVFAAGAVDITPSGTAVAIVKGLGLLEEYAGENYGGQPVIHMTRLAATLLYAEGALEQVDGHLETGLGSLVVAGAGYNAQLATPSAPAAGAGWMYVTGAVNIWQERAEINEMAPHNPYTNEFLAMAERVYTPTFECINAAVEVTEA